jgi:hypothetical protein
MAVAGSSTTEMVCAAATVVLAIIALAGAAPRYFGPIATIAFGVALAEHGRIAGAHFHGIHETHFDRGTRAEVICGVAGVVLGVLALIGLAPPTLIAIAVLAFGGALLIASRETSAAVQGLVGGAAIVLGILALIGFAPRALALVALLALGAAALVNAAAARRMGSMTRW